MTYVKVNGSLYPASVSGRMADRDWGGRESKSIRLAGAFDQVNGLFPDGTEWAIVMTESIPETDAEGNPVLDENGNPVMVEQETEFDNRAFHIRGDLIAHTDGTCTVKMGKLTELERARNGAVTTAALDAAYVEGVNQA